MKMTLIRLVLLLIYLLSKPLFAATTVQKTFTLSLQLPRSSFIVSTPDNDPWLTEVQHMEWDFVRLQFKPLHKQLLIKSSVGAVTARLLQSPVLQSGAEQISLKVQSGSTELGLTAQPLLSASEALEETPVPFILSARPRADGRPYFPGTYLGMVTLLFETSAP